MSYINIPIGIIFMMLGFIHFYWAFFGINDVTAVIPTKSTDDKVLSPGKWATITVGMVLLGFAFIFFNKVFLFMEYAWLDYTAIAIGILFLGRAIGDFNYVGFTKRIKNSRFSRLDTNYYSPLCLMLALLILIQEIL